MYIVKVLTERLGKVDPKAFAAAMHGAKFTVKDNPGVLLDVTLRRTTATSTAKAS